MSFDDESLLNQLWIEILTNVFIHSLICTNTHYIFSWLLMILMVRQVHTIAKWLHNIITHHCNRIIYLEKSQNYTSNIHCGRHGYGSLYHCSFDSHWMLASDWLKLVMWRAVYHTIYCTLRDILHARNRCQSLMVRVPIP